MLSPQKRVEKLIVSLDLQCLVYLSGFSEQIYRNLTLLSRERLHMAKNKCQNDTNKIRRKILDDHEKKSLIWKNHFFIFYCAGHKRL